MFFQIQMGTDNHGVIQSSIALLQERFRQLQREREMREKREILRLFSSDLESNHHNTSTTTPAAATSVPMLYCYEPSKLFFHHPELVFPAALPLSDKFTLSLWPTSQTKDGDVPTNQTPFLRATSCKQFDDSVSDVDTSLHL
ncbi:hypothetical protein Ancab_033376 [Ancistrocladus abbreviatus]